MKKWMYWATVIVLVFGFGVCATAESASAPIISATPMVKMAKGAKVYIMGAGFEPGQEVRILYTDPNGATADLYSYLKPKPVANKEGEWLTVWNCGRYISKKLIKEGVTTINAADNEYQSLAHDSIAFYKGDLSIPSEPPLVIAAMEVEMTKKAEVFIMGVGFKPGTEITILYTDPNGVTADIATDLKPTPVADKAGEWSTTWNCGRYVDKKLILQGVTAIRVTDSEYNLLAHDSILFYVK